MTPLVAAVWSSRPGDATRYPARYLFVFLEHHGMLSVFGSPSWRTVTGGSANYVEAIAMRLHEVAAGLPVRSVQRVPEGVLVAVGSGRPRLFDAAVIATHPDQALLMLAEPTDAERMVLGAIPYSTNEAQLHTDESVLPRNHRARASWNYLVAPDRERCSGHLRRDAVDAAARTAPVHGHARRPRPRRSVDRAGRDDV